MDGESMSFIFRMSSSDGWIPSPAGIDVYNLCDGLAEAAEHIDGVVLVFKSYLYVGCVLGEPAETAGKSDGEIAGCKVKSRGQLQ